MMITWKIAWLPETFKFLRDNLTILSVSGLSFLISLKTLSSLGRRTPNPWTSSIRTTMIVAVIYGELSYHKGDDRDAEKYRSRSWKEASVLRSSQVWTTHHGW